MKNFLFYLSLLLLGGVSACADLTPPQPEETVWFCSTKDPVHDSTERAVAVPKYWQVGQEINCGFKSGVTQAQKDKIAAMAGEWSAACNLKFVFRPMGPYQSMIDCIWGFGSWAYIGTDNAKVLQQNPAAQTMNLGWLNKDGTGADDAIRHEFGHVVCFGHEQQYPDPGGLCMDTAAILAEVRRTQGWDDATIYANIINKYKLGTVRLFPYDPTSIMHYGFPKRWKCIKDFDIVGGKFLSAGDKAAAFAIYPFTTIPPTTTGVNLTAAQIAAQFLAMDESIRADSLALIKSRASKARFRQMVMPTGAALRSGPGGGPGTRPAEYNALTGDIWPIPDGAEKCVVVADPYDGDGIRVQNLAGKTFSIRLRSIDAPDLKNSFVSAEQPYARASRDSLRQWVQRGDTVWVDLHPYEGRTRVSFGRPLGDVYTQGGTLINLLAVSKGWAWYRPGKGSRNPLIPEQMKLRAAEAAAFNLGVHQNDKWILPENWRKKNRY